MAGFDGIDNISQDRKRWRNHNPLSIVLSIVLAVLLVVCIGAIVYLINVDKGEPFTEFYILGLDGKADIYPRVVELGSSGEVILGITNHEYKEMKYWVEITLDGKINAEIGPVLLSQGEKWEKDVLFTPASIGEEQKVEFILYKQDRDNEYLKLNLWIDAKEPQ